MRVQESAEALAGRLGRKRRYRGLGVLLGEHQEKQAVDQGRGADALPHPRHAGEGRPVAELAVAAIPTAAAAAATAAAPAAITAVAAVAA